ncbi:MAG: PepSY domain-containing protein [Candidatus Obscuribacter sp.]|nr:PepSY domain-containing protein [Candidatus Obscuribacter sp.]MBK7836458.1 PepSY domain-containing protein [Candidatus Obscuribacter sp.]MBK9205753.1 PepSY domain-containing protein [Candidatus Obscuribacter sp.]
MPNFAKMPVIVVFAIALGLGLGFTFNNSLTLPAEADGSNNSLLKRTTFTIEQAENLAMSKFPDARVEEIELDIDDSPLVWKIDMKMKPRTKIEFEIDARTGEVLKQEQHKW